MATYTITKTIANTYKLTSTYQTRVHVGGVYEWSNANRAVAYITYDFTAIPANATIDSVDYNFRYSDSKAGTGYQTIRQGENNYDYVSNAAIKRWLTEESKTLKIMTSFKGNDGVETTSDTAPTAVRTINTFTIAVTYTDETGSHIYYATADGWQDCEPYYIVDGVPHICRAYYGVNGAWVEC